MSWLARPVSLLPVMIQPRLAALALVLMACGGPTTPRGGDPAEPTGGPPKADDAPPADDADWLDHIAASAGDDADDEQPVTAPDPSPGPAPTPAPAASLAAKPPPYVIKPLKTSKFLSKRDLAIFNSVCQLDEDAKGVGCRCCPHEPASRWCAEGKFDRQTTIEHVFHGAFTQTGAVEVFATAEGYSCGNLSAWGATWLLRQEGNQWSVVRGAIGTFHVLHGAVWNLADGRRGIVTHDVINKSFTNSIAFTTFAPDGAAKRNELVSWTNSACIHRNAGYFHSVVTYGGANPYDHDKDGKRDLVVTLKVRRRFADAAFKNQCYASWDKGGPSPFASAPEVKHAIPLLFDGRRFTAEPKALARFIKATAEVDKQGKPFPY